MLSFEVIGQHKKKVLLHGNRFASQVCRCHFFGGREVMTKNMSAVRRLPLPLFKKIKFDSFKTNMYLPVGHIG